MHDRAVATNEKTTYIHGQAQRAQRIGPPTRASKGSTINSRPRTASPRSQNYGGTSSTPSEQNPPVQRKNANKTPAPRALGTYLSKSAVIEQSMVRT
ncbi:hypothetical protein OG21DRAFT_1516061 [Imleria badia]|nr:hypothetical protein OG21DRAFT_1516061 [Imleria badia]